MQPFANANGFPTNVLCNLHRRGPSLWHRAQEESCWVCIVLDGVLSCCLEIRNAYILCRSKKCFIDPYWGFDWLCSIPKLGCTDVPKKNWKLRILAFIRVVKQFFKQLSQAKPKENKDSKPLSHLTILPVRLSRVVGVSSSLQEGTSLKHAQNGVSTVSSQGSKR